MRLAAVDAVGLARNDTINTFCAPELSTRVPLTEAEIHFLKDPLKTNVKRCYSRKWIYASFI